jgi:hypothetical protein
VRPAYSYSAGTNLLDGKAVAQNGALVIGPWDVAIVEER